MSKTSADAATAEEISPEDQITINEIARLDYENYLNESSERLRFQHEFSLAALKSLTIVNGGAIVALFTFIGNSTASFDRSLTWWSFASFAGGLSFTLLAYVGAYFSQAKYMHVTTIQMHDAQRLIAGMEPTEAYQPYMTAGNRMLYMAIGSALTGLAGFVGGAAFALAGVLA